VESSFLTIFGTTTDADLLRFQFFFMETATVVDAAMRAHTHDICTMDNRLLEINRTMDNRLLDMNQQMSVTDDTVAKLLTASSDAAKAINKLVATSTGTAKALEAYESLLATNESLVTDIRADTTTIKETLRDVRGRQLNLIRTEIGTTTSGLSNFESECYAALDAVNLRIDALTARLENCVVDENHDVNRETGR
jgi:hypothetical protein